MRFARDSETPQSLSAALAWLLLAALAPLLIGSAWLLWVHWTDERRAADERLLATARALQSAVDRELSLHQVALEVLSTSPLIDRNDWPGFYQAAMKASGVRAGTWVLLGEPSGQTLINTAVTFGSTLPRFLPAPAEGREVQWKGRNLPYFDTAVLWEPLQSGMPRISNLFYGPAVEGPVLALSMPVSREGKAQYSIGFAYSPNAFVDLLGQLTRGEGMVLGLVDNNGRYIARVPHPEQMIVRKAPAPFDDPGKLQAEGFARVMTLDGIDVEFAYRRSDLAGWVMIAGVPRAQLLAPARESLVQWLVLLLLISAIAFGLARRLWRRIAAPLGELARRSRHGPDMDADVPAAGIREIDALREALGAAARVQRALREEVTRRLSKEEREHAATSQRLQELGESDRRKDEFLAMLGHELRNPLAPIANSIAALRKLKGGDATVDPLLDLMERQTRQLAALVEDLLDLSRISTGRIALDMRPLELCAVAAHCAQAVQPRMDLRAHVFSLRCPADTVWVVADETRLTQVIGNLLDNAAKYTAPGGRVVLEIVREPANAVIRVSDTGRGIPEELLPNLFDLFERGGLLDAEGLGIGLHLVKRFAELQGGQVSAQSAGKAKGAVFEVRMPLAPGR